jgi:hypothetical protein
MVTYNWSFNNPSFEAYALGEDLHTPWAGHKRFSYDLIKTFKPVRIVELGTAKGTSLFSFAQSIKDGGFIDSKVFAIDTWQGDKHTGIYGDDVYLFVANEIKEHYTNVRIELIRDTFDNALNFFEDNSIDLLHIDGLHTYEAVKHDFFSWLPKVKQDGIILMHDIHEFNDDFGVHLLWAELKKQYSTLEFEHSHGLGILFLENTKFNLVESQFIEMKNYYHNINYEELKLTLDATQAPIRELGYIKASRFFRYKEFIKKCLHI